MLVLVHIQLYSQLKQQMHHLISQLHSSFQLVSTRSRLDGLYLISQDIVKSQVTNYSGMVVAQELLFQHQFMILIMQQFLLTHWFHQCQQLDKPIHSLLLLITMLQLAIIAVLFKLLQHKYLINHIQLLDKTLHLQVLLLVGLHHSMVVQLSQVTLFNLTQDQELHSTKLELLVVQHSATKLHN